MIRYECLQRLAAFITDQLVVTSLSGQKIEWAHLSDHDGNLLIGNMGNALGVGLGLALALPHRRVIVLESDGSVLLSLFNLPTLANLRPRQPARFRVRQRGLQRQPDQRAHGHRRENRPSEDGGRSGNRERVDGDGYRVLRARRDRGAHQERTVLRGVQGRGDAATSGHTQNEYAALGKQVPLRPLPRKNGRTAHPVGSRLTACT